MTDKNTSHVLYNCDSRDMKEIPDATVNLIVTSPPYPMIEMWDDLFISLDDSINDDMQSNSVMSAFRKMHTILNATWKECDRVLKDNGFICINIGDATRTFNDNFQLFSNHTEIINCFLSMGYSVLPDILWRKQSNSPNKFMGSGMYPAGAYVTYEHEYILVFRKGGKRVFKGEEKSLRQKSAYFWEERNIWFSDLWDVKGTSQFVDKNAAGRSRNASFPLEIPYRLVNMYSAEKDVVLDPFCGLGTTSLACMISKRNSIGVDISSEMIEMAADRLNSEVEDLNKIIENRINDHISFISSLSNDKKMKCYKNENHDMLVKTRQETAICLDELTSINLIDKCHIECQYGNLKYQLSF